MRPFIRLLLNNMVFGFKSVMIIILITILFYFISINYSYESRKSEAYCHIIHNGQYFELLNEQIKEDKSIILVDSEQILRKSMKTRPFSYGMIIDSNTLDVEMILRGYESDTFKSNIITLASYIDRKNTDVADIVVDIVARESTHYRQNEKQATSIFMYLIVSVLPFLMMIFLMFKEKKVIFDQIIIYFDMKHILFSKVLYISLICFFASNIFMALATQSQIDTLRILPVMGLTSLLSTLIGALLVSFYDNLYRALVPIFFTLVLLLIPILELVFDISYIDIRLNPLSFSLSSIDALVLYNKKSYLIYQTIGINALLSLFIAIMAVWRYSKLKIVSR